MVEIRRYLLGNVSGDDYTGVEERLLTDDEYFEELLMEEDELIDDYLHGMLSRQEKKRFEKIFLVVPERREKLDFARTLQQYNNPPAAGGMSLRNWAWLFDWWSFLMSRQVPLVVIAALIVAAVGVTWFAAQAFIAPHDMAQEKLAVVQAERDALQKQLSAQQAEQRGIEQALAQLRQAGQPDRTPQPLADIEVRKRSASPVFSFQLPLIQVKSTGTPASMLELPNGIETVRLQIDLEDDGFKLYRAVLQTEDEQPVKTWSNIKPNFEKGLKQLKLDLPAALLSERTFLVQLRGIEQNNHQMDLGGRPFRVMRK